MLADVHTEHGTSAGEITLQVCACRVALCTVIICVVYHATRLMLHHCAVDGDTGA